MNFTVNFTAVDVAATPLYLIVVAVFAVAAAPVAGLLIVTYLAFPVVTAHFPATLGFAVNVASEPAFTLPLVALSVTVGFALLTVTVYVISL